MLVDNFQISNSLPQNNIVSLHIPIKLSPQRGKPYYMLQYFFKMSFEIETG